MPDDVNIVNKTIAIDDDPFSDLFSVLGPANSFINAALAQDKVEVLVYCRPGFIALRRDRTRMFDGKTGYLVRYGKVLIMARRYRPVITINVGFVEELGARAAMGYAVCGIRYAVCKESGEGKEMYGMWKEERDKGLEKGEESVEMEEGRGGARVEE